ncbi:MAG: aldo/keto reductase [Candidatus Paceibacterota bacterium]
MVRKTKQRMKTMEISEITTSVNQLEFHPFYNRMDLLNFCQEQDITVTAYSPLAQFKTLEIDVVNEISRKYDKTPAQVILKWELQKETIPIPKSKSEKHLEENIRIFNWELDSRDLEKIDSIEKEEQALGLPISASKIPFPIALFINRLSSSSIS